MVRIKVYYLDGSSWYTGKALVIKIRRVPSAKKREEQRKKQVMEDNKRLYGSLKKMRKK